MKLHCGAVALLLAAPVFALASAPARERLNFDRGWRFALGHAHDNDKDFGHAKAYFSYLTKAGYGDGPADPKFDDRAWRLLDLPHDWAVELPFDPKASHSHGYRPVGRGYPATSVGWYRKAFFIPEADRGRRLSIALDGVHRDAVVWVNGFYLGREASGYVGAQYDFTDVASYGATNVIAVRADATLEEGWFYEGAGIYRHAWLVKTAPLHFERDGIFVHAEPGRPVTIEAAVLNEGNEAAEFSVEHEVRGSTAAVQAKASLSPGLSQALAARLDLPWARLWSLQDPHLYTLISRLRVGGQVVDEVETRFGVRSLAWDAEKGFFLNGKSVKIKGVCQHQDHAGVGTAIPDALQEWRVRQLQAMGANAIRCAHNPPTPELLDICDRLGVLVLPENRLMGTSPELLAKLAWLVKRDRNHPSVFAWSLGNEEWSIEGNELGPRLALPATALVKRLDPTRLVTAASSGGWEHGTARALELAGYNYRKQGDMDAFHAKFPNKPGLGTEESDTFSTRGVYVEGQGKDGHAAPNDRTEADTGVEASWRYYMERPFVAGLFYWTGFDYKGEPNPDGWPQVTSNYGILDGCGFPKDPWQYLRTWWREEPAVHIAPHWNWSGKEGKDIEVWVRANTEEVELSLNGASLGAKPVPRLGHVEWKVPYAAGALKAVGRSTGKELASALVETAGPAAKVGLRTERAALRADGADLAVVEVRLLDSQGRFSPLAGDELTFKLSGPGRILGVGNGDPASHEPDRILDEYRTLPITGVKALALERSKAGPEMAADYDDSAWKPMSYEGGEHPYGQKSLAVRGVFELDEPSSYSEIVLLPKPVLDVQDIYVNGKRLHQGYTRAQLPSPALPLPAKLLKKGANTWSVFGKPMTKLNQWDPRSTVAGELRTVKPAKPWTRRAFNGLAQVLVQATDQSGSITLEAGGAGLQAAKLVLRSGE